MERRTQIIIGSAITLTALISYAIYADLTRLFPKKDDKKSKD